MRAPGANGRMFEEGFPGGEFAMPGYAGNLYRQ